MKYLFFLISFLAVQYSFSQKISTIGGWTEVFDATDIINAGLDYDSSYLSATNQTRISVQFGGRGRNKTAYIYIEQQDVFWNNNLALEARVTSTIHGNTSGTSFQTITENPQYFFYTSGKINNIPIQYRLTGLSVTLPVDTYTTEVVYTILDF